MIFFKFYIFHFYFSETDQKKNPKAVVTALKFYASAMKQSQDDKFMMTAKSVCPSDDDIDLQFDMRKLDFPSNNTPSNGLIF